MGENRGRAIKEHGPMDKKPKGAGSRVGGGYGWGGGAWWGANGENRT